MFQTPILLISWQRPQKTLKVLNEIRKISPTKIYLACDGPIKNDPVNKEKVLQTRKKLFLIQFLKATFTLIFR